MSVTYDTVLGGADGRLRPEGECKGEKRQRSSSESKQDEE